MRRRQTLPQLWLITDPRGGDPVAALRRLPRGSGVVVRHFELEGGERAALLDRLRAEARRRGGLALLATPPQADGRWMALGEGLLAIAAHDRRDLVAAWREAADLVFVSPVFATRSHPGARPLGPVRLGLMLDGRLPAYALGGMNARRFKRLNGLGLHGWAAIDAFR